MNIDSKTRKEYTKIATYYYELGMTQEEIANKFLISRQKVNRVIKKCIEIGIVKITIQDDQRYDIEIEMELEKKYSLKEVVITDSSENLYEALGKAAANYFRRVIRDNDIIGFSRGRTISALLNNMDNITSGNLSVCQLVGGDNCREDFLNYDAIVRKASEILNARAYYLYAPTVVTSAELKESLLKEDSFINVYKKLKNCSVAVVGIGKTFDKDDEKRTSRITKEDYVKILNRKAIGEICARHFDIDGNSVNGDVDSKIIGIETSDFKQIPLRLGLAGGLDKVEAIKGALRGEYINVLVTDKNTAKELLK